MSQSDQDDELLSEVASYYSDKLTTHGETPLGVDWNGEASQHLRFEQLCRIIDDASDFSINDLGCGYGALVDYLSGKYQHFSYSGFDVSEKMVAAANSRYQSLDHVRFRVGGAPDQKSDFGIGSGIFNVRQKRSDLEWAAYIKSTLASLDRTSQRGFAFNCLTSYSDADKMRDYLYYANPCELFDFCKRSYSRQVALLHDYELYEFTILVRKS